MFGLGQRTALKTRVLLSSSLALILALSLMGVIMHQAFKEKTLQLVEERLEGYLYALIAYIEYDENQLVMPDNYPTPRMEQPASGIYGQILIRDFLWQTPSILGQDIPDIEPLSTNQRVFNTRQEFAGVPYFYLSQGVAIETDDEVIHATIAVSENAGEFYDELAAFRESLLTWIVVISGGLLVVQWVIMFWATRPLKRLMYDLSQLEQGADSIFSEDYPLELRGLTASLNRLIENERNSLQRQRRTLGDLAHSLKTPLAIIHSELDNQPVDKVIIKQQIIQMDEIVAYQLKRAAVAGHRTFVQGIPVIDVVDKIIDSLQKVHRHKNVEVKTTVAPGAEFFGEQGDLMELLGNLLENAFKWCDLHIHITIKTLIKTGRQRTGLIIEIGDDGPGIAQHKRETLLKRGVRGDEKVTGHGIGLSIVTDIVESYQGELSIERDPELHGALFKIILPP
ncbi:ATP-binding protein [Marinicella gelatinilytica]|uniref:ATP-binding protein n=1 Tax=Marinicella gelatinilytica TaxID=2996017 RepID=UPI002260D14B|nr:ATP-binding protein [Marinicella gelatinilytica]MCX7545102.1 ATP-binding protein [Marinicella gelatinilytica]